MSFLRHPLQPLRTPYDQVAKIFIQPPMYDSDEPSQVIYQPPPSDGQAAEPDSPTLAAIASFLRDMD